MRVNARLDAARSEKLRRIQETWSLSTSEALKQAIDSLFDRLLEEEKGAYRILDEEGFIGCAEGPTELSRRYKQDLVESWMQKHAGDR